MDNRTEIAIKKRTGDVSLNEDFITGEQKQTFERVMAMVDRNPRLNWVADRDNHNTDFCLIEGKIEPVKSFCTKVQFIAGLSMENTGQQVLGEGNDTQVISNVRVWREGDARTITMSGASTVVECGATRRKPNPRAFHDALARSQTRAFKSAIEMYMGFPFINLAIQMIFGGFDVQGEDPLDHGVGPRDVSEPPPDELERKRIANAIWKRIKIAHAMQLYTDDEKEARAYKIKKNKHSKEALIRIKDEIEGEINWLKEGSKR